MQHLLFSHLLIGGLKCVAAQVLQRQHLLQLAAPTRQRPHVTRGTAAPHRRHTRQQRTA
jgi:hypothetical protein